MVGGSLDDWDVASGVDAWILAGLPGPVRYASYLVERLSPQYRLIVDVLLATQAHSLTGVARDDLPSLLAAAATDRVGLGSSGELLAEGSFDLDSRMAQLHSWGVVEVWQDRAATEADFLRNRDRYQLTPEAAALHRFVLDIEGSSDSDSSAALLAPAIIAERLDDFTELIENGDFGGAEQQWTQVEVTLRDMAGAAGRWQAHMAGALAGAPTPAKIATLRTTLLAYVDTWGAGVDIHSPRIGERTHSAEALDHSVWRRLALARRGSEVDEQALEIEVENHVQTLATLRAWFVGASCQGVRLRRQIRDSIGDLVRGHRALLHVGGSVSRRADLLRVASAIEQARDDDEGWSLWCRATGLFSCAHLSLAVTESQAGSRTSFWDAPPVPVQARLRTQGPRSLVGKPAQIPDMAAARERARQREAATRRELLEAEAGVRRRSGRALSEWGSLTPSELDLLMDLLGAAREGADGSRTGITADGRLRVAITARPGCSAVLTTRDGRLVVADSVVEVENA